MGFGNNVANTAFVATLTTVLVTLLSLLSGYAMSRYRFYGKTFIYVLMLATQMLPAVVLMIPCSRRWSSCTSSTACGAWC